MNTPAEYKHHTQLTGRIAPALAAFVLLVATVAPALANQDKGDNLGNPGIAPPQSDFLGHSYSQWSVAFFQWVYSLPTTHHPLFDTADCSVGQRGDVWFLDGRLGGQGFPTTGRNCTVPAGTALFLDLAASTRDAEGCDPTDPTVILRTNETKAELQQSAHDNLNAFLGTRHIVIDGVEVQGLPQCDPAHPTTCDSPYRVQARPFDRKIPAFDNILMLEDGICYEDPTGRGKSYQVHGAVADGVYVMIKPLSAGEHTIRFGPLDATGQPTRQYNITVTDDGNDDD